MSRPEIAQRVDQILIDEFELDAARIHPPVSLFDDLGLDSLDAVDLIASLEAEFGGRIPEERAKTVRTVGDVYTLVVEHLDA